MKAVLSLIGVYSIFLIVESVARYQLSGYFNQAYIQRELYEMLPYLLAYLVILWIALIVFMGWMLHSKVEDKDQHMFTAWILIFGFIAIPLTGLVFPFFIVLFR